MHVPQLLVLFVLRPNMDDNGIDPLSDQALDAVQSQLQQTVALLQESRTAKDYLVKYSQLN